jgi:hypothetical protein
MKYVLRYAMASDLDLARVGALFPEHRERWGPFRVEGTLLAIGSSRSRIQSPGSLTLMSARPFVGGLRSHKNHLSPGPPGRDSLHR